MAGQTFPTIYLDQSQKNAPLAGFFQNLLGGILQQQQQRAYQQDLQTLLTSPWWQSGGKEGTIPSMRTQQGSLLIEKLADPTLKFETLEREARTGEAIARTKLYERQTEEKAEPTVSDYEARYLGGLPQEKRDEILQQKLTRPGVSVNIAGTERQQIAQTEASIDALDNLKSLFELSGRKTGWLRGRWEAAKGIKEGLNPPEQEAFMAATSAFKNQVIKEITGAQLSEKEAQRIMKQIPDITDPPTRWLAKWEQSKINLQNLQKRRLEVMEKTGADISKLKTLADDPLGLR